MDLNHSILEEDKIRALIKKAQAGSKKARNKIILHHLKFIKHIIKLRRLQGYDPEALFSEGCIGICRAIEKFNLSRKTRFSTYAAYHITQRIHRHVENNGSTIRVPVYMQGRIREIARKKDPTPEERDILEYIPRVRSIEGIFAQGRSASFAALDLKFLLRLITDREKDIIKSRLEGETLVKIGRRHRISRERVRQLYNTAVEKMKKITDSALKKS